MDELVLLAEMRSEVPGDTRYPDAQRTLMAEIGGGTTQRKKKGKRLIVIGSGLLVGAVAASTVVALDSGDSRHTRPPRAIASTPKLQLVAVTSPMALAHNATALAQNSPNPASNQWIYQKLETTVSHAAPSGAMPQVPGSHTYREKWDRVDWTQFATIHNGKLVTTARPRQGRETVPHGWPKTITYPYLNSLPTDPVKLLAVLKQNGNLKDSDIFTAVIALMANYPLPAKLNAAFYGVLARLKSVHLGHVTDLAGRHVLSLDNVDQGLKTSILVNPTTYTYAGQQTVVVADKTEKGTDGTLHLTKGELLNDQAVLVSKIVDQPGER
ncbi:CU044_5270 family protein [Actinoallomurus acaciae]|uniref:CU044_5270 family protein n=1 Tax=Actinoallomurus acaciae TaxID=502577 RepID=A0ABV5YE26_9ACTN